MICFTGTSEAQTVVPVLEKLPDGTVIVEVAGQKQRTMTPAQLRAIAEDRAELDRLRRLNTLLTEDRDTLKEMVTQWKAQAADWKAIADSRQTIILKYEALSPAAKGRVSGFFDNPFVQVGLKAVVPLFTFALSTRKN